MSKLIYIHGDDDRLFEIVHNALTENGYAAEYATLSDSADFDRIRADIALICNHTSPSSCVTVGGITLNADTKSACDENGKRIHFTPIEFSMLLYLMNNVHRAVSRAELLSVIWGYDDNTVSRVADDTAKRLRRKLNGHRLKLETVWNFGFRVHEQ
ncbi:MAG: winged helix-turn-helix transcriptional regulator [Ruminococcaceae bacterium]|nr:winged helix-turn-helix transcriptional regulator [Oscillospiraceae bacterium]